MRVDDRRIRYQVTEEIYTRRLKVEELTIDLDTDQPDRVAGVPFEAITFQGAPVGNWVIQRAMTFIGANPIVNGRYRVTHSLQSPMEFGLPTGPVMATGVNFWLRISGGWFAQQVSLDATAGVYDWLRRRVRLAPGPGQFLVRNVDVYKGDPIDQPPDSELKVPREMQRGEMALNLVLVDGLEDRKPAPPLNEFVVPEDRDLRLKELQPEAYRSVGAR